MRRFFLATVAVTWFAGFGLPRSAGEENPRAVLEKAIQAHGGAERLARLKAVVRTAQGKLAFGGGNELTATCDAFLVPPHQARWSIELELNGQKVPVVVSVNGAKGWRSGGGTVKEMTPMELEEPRTEAYVTWLTSLLPLRESGFELSSLPAIQVAEAPAVGFKVARKGSPDVKLYFDKQSGLLVKAERKGKEAGIESNKEYFFSDFKEFGGMKLAALHVEKSNGKKMAEWTITGYKFPGRIDEKEFTKP